MFVLNVLLTIKPDADRELVLASLKQAAKLSREEPGCLSFEACVSEADPNFVILCERWASKQAWEEHKLAEAFTKIYQPEVLPFVDRVPHICQLLES